MAINLVNKLLVLVTLMLVDGSIFTLDDLPVLIAIYQLVVEATK